MVNPASDSCCEPPRRAIVLGASNVARGLSTIVQTSRWACGSPLEILLAMGRGRSYGMESSLLGRKISGILQCGLWQSLTVRPDARSVALVTDIGNDILYGVSVSEVLDWVQTCLDRLETAGCRTVMTELPIARAQALSEWQFRLLRSLLVPSCRLTLSATLDRIEQLNSALRILASERQMSLIPQKNQWFGFDPIHIKRRYWSAAWQEILSPWCLEEPDYEPVRSSMREAAYLLSRVPEERRLCGFTQRCEQPAGRLSDGTTIALY